MDSSFKKLVKEKWETYFPNTAQPIGAFYADSLHGAEYVEKPAPNPHGYTCMFAQMTRLHSGRSLAFDVENLGCFGSSQILFGRNSPEETTVQLMVEVERFKKDAEQVRLMMKNGPQALPTGRYVVMKPLEQIVAGDEPQIYCIFARPDAIAALHCLAGFDDSRADAVIVPFGSGCEQLLGYPFSERRKPNPRAVLGGMDPAQRCCMKPDLQTFAVTAGKFRSMVENMDDTFLNTFVWEAIRPRLMK